MLNSEYLRYRNVPVTTGSVKPELPKPTKVQDGANIAEETKPSFGDMLDAAVATRTAAQARISQPQITEIPYAADGGVEFSAHAMRRVTSRNIDIHGGDLLSRLNRGVELAASKGSNDALVLVDNAAFVVSVRNNKVITTMSGEDMRGAAFTGIDSTVIM